MQSSPTTIQSNTTTASNLQTLPLDPSHKLEVLIQIPVLQQHHLPVVSHLEPTTKTQSCIRYNLKEQGTTLDQLT